MRKVIHSRMRLRLTRRKRGGVLVKQSSVGKHFPHQLGTQFFPQPHIKVETS